MKMLDSQILKLNKYRHDKIFYKYMKLPNVLSLLFGGKDTAQNIRNVVDTKLCD